MKFFLLLLFFTFLNIKSQSKENTIEQNKKVKDTLIIDSGKKDSLTIFKPTIKDYLYQHAYQQKIEFDTVFSQNNTYKFSQYSNEDTFGKIQMANIGFGYNPLTISNTDNQHLSLLPTHKSYTIINADQIKYYDVKTPTTSFIYHTAMRNGAALQTTYTQNIGKTFNFAIEYMGLRSQGFYRNALSTNNNTLFSAHYLSKKQNYELFAHYIHQNINNQENGGIVDNDLFISGDSEFRNRINAQVHLSNSVSKFSYRRYFFSHQYSPNATSNFPVKLRHTLTNEINKFYYQQYALENYWFTNENEIINGFTLDTKKNSENLKNTISLVLDNKNLKLEGGLQHEKINFGLNEIAIPTEFPNNLKENRWGLVGNLDFKIENKLQIVSSLQLSKGKEFGNFLASKNKLFFQPIKNYPLEIQANFTSSYPTFNYIANASVYKKFNYYLAEPKNQNTSELIGTLSLLKYKTKIIAEMINIQNYTYFDENYQPKQAETSLSISKIGGETTVDFGQFHLNGQLLFQKGITSESLLPLPNFVGRLALFYQSKAFKKAAEIQTGIKVYYFSKFKSRTYLPIYNEYVVNNNDFVIGGQPIVDVFFNMKVKKMFFYIEGQQVGTLLLANKAYVFPDYPTYDFRLNIGIVWHLFN